MTLLVIMVLWPILGFTILTLLDLTTKKTLGFEALEFPYILFTLPLWPIVIALSDRPKKQRKEPPK